LRISSRLYLDGPQHEVGARHRRALPLIIDLSPDKEAGNTWLLVRLVRLGGAVKEDGSLGLPAGLTDTDLALWIGAKRRSRRGPAGLAIARSCSPPAREAGQQEPGILDQDG
jgi:hypothetical protein